MFSNTSSYICMHKAIKGHVQLTTILMFLIYLLLLVFSLISLLYWFQLFSLFSAFPPSAYYLLHSFR